MRLYTICIDQRPVVVISVDAEPPIPDSLTTRPDLMQTLRESRAQIESIPADPRTMDQMEIDEALDTYLGEDLQSLTCEGNSLWDGDHARLHIREARVDEAERWHLSRRAAIDAGEVAAGEEAWLTFLVPVDRDDEDP
jgi:hypothetical protein